MSDEHAIFRTKSGFCRVERDRLRLERTGVRGGAAQALHGDSKARTWLVYCAVVAGSAYVCWSELQAGNMTVAMVFAALVGWLVLSLARARDFSMANEVLRSRTDRIELIRGVVGLTRDRVVLHFRDDAGKLARRFILLPGLLQRGQGEFERARVVLERQGWL